MRLRSRIAFRIFAFNVLLVFLPVAAFSLLGSYERGLVDSLEHALAQQGRIIAAWLGQEASGKAGEHLDARAAKRALEAIGDRRTARFRIVNSSGSLLADSSDAEARVSFSEAEAPDADSASLASGSIDREPLLYRVFSAPARLWRRFLAPPQPPFSSADFYASDDTRLLGSEVLDALAGRYGAATRVSSGGQVSVTLYCAVPVLAGDQVVGAVLVSQSTYRILRDLYAIRLDISKIFLGSLAAAVALSLLLALTIVGPLKKLGDAAAIALGTGVSPGERLSAAFPESRRSDEIGDLQRSLRVLVIRLEERARQTARFAADAAHELRNPLAAIRSAAELADDASDSLDRSHFHRAIVDDAERMHAIVDGLRRLSLAERGTDRDSKICVDLGAAARAACDRVRLGHEQEVEEKALSFAVEEGKQGTSSEVDPAALDVILDNLVRNAASFATSMVRIAIGEAESKKGKEIERSRDLTIAIEDDGPGIPVEHLERVFDRFFTWRPGHEGSRHTGLGLALARALAEAEGGSLEAENRETCGARFVLRLPGPGHSRTGGGVFRA